LARGMADILLPTLSLSRSTQSQIELRRRRGRRRRAGGRRRLHGVHRQSLPSSLQNPLDPRREPTRARRVRSFLAPQGKRVNPNLGPEEVDPQGRLVTGGGRNLVISGVERRHAGNYTCTAFNTEGEDTSRPLQLDVKCEFEFVVLPSPFLCPSWKAGNACIFPHRFAFFMSLRSDQTFTASIQLHFRLPFSPFPFLFLQQVEEEEEEEEEATEKFPPAASATVGLPSISGPFGEERGNKCLYSLRSPPPCLAWPTFAKVSPAHARRNAAFSPSSTSSEGTALH